MVSPVVTPPMWHRPPPTTGAPLTPSVAPDLKSDDRLPVKTSYAAAPVAGRKTDPRFVDAIPPEPGIGEAGRPISDDEYIHLMTAILSASEGQLQDMLTSIDQFGRMNRTQMQRQLEATARQAEAMAKEKNASEWGFWLGLIGDVAMLAAALALTVATGGAASPLLALAVVNTALTSWEIVAKVANRYGGAEFGPAAVVTKLLKSMGVDDKSASEIGTWSTLAVKLVLAMGNFAVMWRSSLAVSFEVAKKVSAVSQAVGTASQMAEAGTAIGSTAMADERYKAQWEASRAKTLSTLLKTYIDRAVNTLDQQFALRQEFSNNTRRQLELAHESRNIPFSQYA